MGFTLLQTGNLTPALPPEDSFGTPQQLRHQLLVSHSNPKLSLYNNFVLTGHVPISANVGATYHLTAKNPNILVTVRDTLCTGLNSAIS